MILPYILLFANKNLKFTLSHSTTTTKQWFLFVKRILSAWQADVFGVKSIEIFNGSRY